ncbi:ARID/BRIGHT DNA-binding domain containing protein [Rhodotorula toruloides]|uniref:ARID/BRIGHT DNA-binding domain containing protein n=1 Tax=Rhodotorula toruloides TaxID=5286 RepID=A0A511K9W5_RHOTO|nr:ARID/BRIGHT DNA-binding domain containing protein [Rhodotorula toruloides]
MYAEQAQDGQQQQYPQPVNAFGTQQVGFRAGAYSQQQQQQQQGQAVNAGDMFAGQSGGNRAGGQAYTQNGGQPFASANAFATGESSGVPYGVGSPAVSTSNLLQQQLAAQQAAFSQNPSTQPNQPSLAQQQYMQNMQQQQIYQQARNAQQQQHSYPFANPSLPANSQPPKQPSQASPPPTAQQRPSGQTITQQDIQNALHGVNLNGMTQERFQQLTPIQQAAIREVMMSRSRAQQQASLGLGMPGATATPPRPTPAQPNGPPTPAAGGVPSTPVPPQTNVFLKTLTEFYAKRGVPFSGPPVVEGRTIDLARMFAAVTQGGGFNGVTTNRKWGLVATALNFPAASPEQHPPERLQGLMTAYHQTLLPFEMNWQQVQRMRAAASAAANTSSPNGAAPSPISAMTPAPALPAPGTPQNLAMPPPRASATPAPVTAPSPYALPSQPPTSAPSPTQPVAAASPASFPTSAGASRPTTAGTSQAPTSGLAESVKVEGAASAAWPELAAASTSTAPPLATSSSELTTKPTEPAVPPRRKRRRIEYRPLARPLDTYGGQDLQLIEQAYNRAEKARSARKLPDLGLVDVHGLTMSLRSRMATEVAYALNVLTLISLQMTTEEKGMGLRFPFEKCPDLLEELLELLEETALGPDEEGELQGVIETAKGKEVAQKPQTYRELFRLIEEQANELDPPRTRPHASTVCDFNSILRPGETTLAVVNVLRNLALAENNARYISHNQRIAELFIRVASLPLKDPSDPAPPRWPARVSAADSMSVKKAAIELLSQVGAEVELDSLSPSTAQHALDLVLFFIRDAELQREAFACDLSNTPSMVSRVHQPHAGPTTAIPPYLHLGLSACARLALKDRNRSVIARLMDPEDLYRIFISLAALLPISEKDFQIMTFETGLLFVHGAIMSLYNLAFLAPASVKARLRADPKVHKSLFRIVRRLAGTQVQSNEDDIYLLLANRSIAILQLLDDGGEGGRGKKKGTPVSAAQADLPWYGMSMSGLDDAGSSDNADEEVDEDAADEGIDGNLAASEATVRRNGHETETAPILAGESRQLYEYFASASMPLVLPSLVAMADGTRSKKRRK